MVHIVNKGKQGEREAIKYLQPIINDVCDAIEVSRVELYRNQNQSALGGYDIDGLPWLAIEIKRQEALSINTWWKQVNNARADNQVPLLMFRQNRKKWRFIINSHIHTGGSGFIEVRSELNADDFKRWFQARLKYELLANNL